MRPLEYLASLDTVREMWACLTPEQQICAILRAEGLDDGQIAKLLGLSSHAVVSMRLTKARINIIRAMPELRILVEGRYNARKRQPDSILGRRYNDADPTPPLERGWLVPEFYPESDTLNYSTESALAE